MIKTFYKFASQKNPLLRHLSGMNYQDLNKPNHEDFDLKTYKKFLLFLKFQEMMDSYNA